jgi:Zn-dependent alcohol dehydrogenase
VKAVGSAVKVAQPGDPVLLSFNFCGCCAPCATGHPSLCLESRSLNFIGNKVFSCSRNDSSDPNTIGSFFGQSSFANYSIAAENSVVNAKGLVDSIEELRLLAPLGCGIQTGHGTITNVANAQPESTVAIMGLGGVGLSAIMGAKLRGCKTIIGIDKVASRLDLAKELGATHVVSTAGMEDLSALADEVKKFTNGLGPSIVVDTTGFIPLIECGIGFTGPRGHYIQVGSSPRDKNVSLNFMGIMIAGKSISGAIEGDVTPTDYVPKMVGWWREGKLPLEKIVKFFKAEEFAQAIQEMHEGTTVKPIIVW